MDVCLTNDIQKHPDWQGTEVAILLGAKWKRQMLNTHAQKTTERSSSRTLATGHAETAVNSDYSHYGQSTSESALKYQTFIIGKGPWQQVSSKIVLGSCWPL